MLIIPLILALTGILPANNLPPNEPVSQMLAPSAVKLKAGDPSVGYRKAYRYKGKIGSAEVTVWLETDSLTGKLSSGEDLLCEGFYFYDKHRRKLTLRNQKFDPRQPLVLEESVIDREQDKLTVTGRFMTAGLPGKTLNGTWLSPDGKRKLPFSLQEDYTGAVKYLSVGRAISGRPCKDGGVESGYEAEYYLSYLLVQVPGRPEVEARLRKILGGPKPEEQMPAYLKNLMKSGEYDCQELSETVLVKYNGDDILSVENHSSFHGYGAPRFYHSFTGTNLNLRTGAKLHLSDLLKPGFEQDSNIPPRNDENYYPEDPNDYFTIEPDGLTFYLKYGANVEEKFVRYENIQYLIRPEGPLKGFLYRK
ncbi:hypothetical protein [Adhaeribacter soli]|uniref:Uncharacterized protein n=1 Tax=Adhaeribacter soli TaxID=2607655 RepID=A0A5N1J103_9BACT|nr:hypothetical protein [Adhaeribacter soli]KAA9340171.1 hypothetical protein F0P94_07435 [Adhaeribacter soli]